jgi:Ca-activated chloride channel family protein
VGSKTFFRKANRWVDAEVKAEDEAKAIVIEQFSEPFFQLAREQTSSRNQYFSFEEPVTVELGGKIYRIEPPKAR